MVLTVGSWASEGSAALTFWNCWWNASSANSGLVQQVTLLKKAAVLTRGSVLTRLCSHMRRMCNVSQRALSHVFYLLDAVLLSLWSSVPQVQPNERCCLLPSGHSGMCKHTIVGNPWGIGRAQRACALISVIKLCLTCFLSLKMVRGHKRLKVSKGTYQVLKARALLFTVCAQKM